MNPRFESQPGCLIRTDYLAILRIVRDNPGIMTTGIYAQLPCERGTSASRRRIGELVDAGLLERTSTNQITNHRLTQQGQFILQLVESIAGAVM